MELNKNNLIKTLDLIYQNVLLGLPKTPSLFEFAQKYLNKHNDNEENAIDALIQWQSSKNASTSLMTGFGGLLTMPITIPVELASTWYIQLRMIGAIAQLSGLDPRSDEVKIIIYYILVDDKSNSISTETGLNLNKKFETILSLIHI